METTVKSNARKMSALKKKFTADNIFNYVNNALLIVLSLVMIYPILYIFLSAVSEPTSFRQAINNHEFIIIPQGFTMEYLMEHLKNVDIWKAYGNTVLITVAGTAISLFITVTCAYVLSRRGLKVVKIFTILVAMTMWLKPGMIATYVNIDNFGMIRSYLGILIPFAVSGYNVILMKTYFQAIPQDIDECAQIDGASHFRILFNIYLPSSIPGLTTIGLFYAIDRWNGYFWAEQVLRDDDLYPLQVIVKKILQSASGENTSNPFEGLVSAYALIVIAIVPMLILFPLIQKYFKKGVMVGSVK